MEQSQADGQFESRLMKWFNEKIDKSTISKSISSISNNFEGTNHLNICNSSDSYMNFNQIWSRMPFIDVSSIDWKHYMKTPHSREWVQQRHISPVVTTNYDAQWTYQLIKSVLINYQQVWLETFFATFLNRNSTCSVHFRFDNLSEENLIQKLVKILATTNDRTQIITHLISIIYWLDVAKLKPLLENDPCLFISPNSSENIFEKFCQSVFLPERIQRLRYRLKQMGFRLQHHETRIHHLDFRIKILSSDLADGIRLARVIQLLFPGRFGYLFSKLKYPSERISSCIYNVHLVFRECKPLLQYYDSKFEWSPENAKAVANNYRQQTLQTIDSLMRIDLAIQVKQHYCPHLNQVIQVQRFIQSWLLTKKLRNQYVNLRKAVILVQRRYRAKVVAHRQRLEYVQLRNCTILIQRWFRQNKYWALVRNHIRTFTVQRQQAARTIQRYWRGYSTRIKFYAQNASIHRIVFKLEQLRLDSSTSLISIGTRADRILKRLTKNIDNNNEIRCIINDQFMSDMPELYKFCSWSLEVRRYVLKWQQLLRCWSQLIVRMNRSEQHKMCTYWIVSIFDLVLDQQMLFADLYGTELTLSLIHVMSNHSNYAPLVLSSLRLIKKMIQKCSGVGQKLLNNKKWSRLSKRIATRYRIFGENSLSDCDQCQAIQLQLNAIYLELSYEHFK